MAREVFVSLDGGRPGLMRVEVGGRGRIPAGTAARGRWLLPFGRRRLADPGGWIELEFLGSAPKAIGNAAVYRAARRDAATRGVSGA